MLLTVFFIKLLDCAFNVLKSIYLYKNKYFISSILASISTILFIAASDIVANANEYGDNKTFILFAIFAANFIGNYFPPKVIERCEEDKLYIYEITSDTIETGKRFADTLKELGIPVSTYKGYNKTTKAVLVCKAYSENRLKSKIIESNIPKEFKWHIVTPTMQ